jgi:hypothetical protein
LKRGLGHEVDGVTAQQAILGPAKFALYRDSKLAPSDLVGFQQDVRWGWTGYERTLAQVGQEPNPHLPPRTAKPPADRHYFNRINQRSRVRAKNTVIAPWVDVRSDIAAINAGQATRKGDYFLVNGRRYQQEANGTLAPIDGEGFFPLTAMAYNALVVYTQFGESARAEGYIARMREMADEAKQQAIAVYRAMRAGRS